MRSIQSFSLALFAIILSLAITGCGDDDDGGNGGITEANLTAKTWGLSAINNNLTGQGNTVAALFTEAEIMDNGFDSEEELASELDFTFVLLSLFANIDECITNDGITFQSSGAVGFDFTDDCPNGESGIFIEDGSSSNWSLTGNQLTIVETVGTDVTTSVFEVTALTETTLEMRLSGNALLTTFEYETAANPTNLNLTYVFVAL
jgi:hypothetical protein